MDESSKKIIGYGAIDVRSKNQLLRTGSWYHNTAKIYPNLGVAKAAIRNSNHRRAMEEGHIRFFPVTIPNDL